MKMLIAYLFTEYDVRLAEGNPKARGVGEGWLLEFLYPPKGVRMMVRRRVVG